MIQIIAEIGINHNGDLQLCKEMMRIAKQCGVNMVKLQKRSPEDSTPLELRGSIRKTPWGEMTYLQYRHKIEFSREQIAELFDYASELGIELFASVWDKPSADLMHEFTALVKIPSAIITNLELCRYIRSKFAFVIMSTGMSTEQEIISAIDAVNPDVIMHTNSTYPCPVEDLNLRYIEWLRQKYPTKKIGYSGHEFGLVTTFATVPMGVEWIERHFTLDRTMWGSDQESSVEPIGFQKLVKGVRDLEKALQYPPGPRIFFQKEGFKRRMLRGVGADLECSGKSGQEELEFVAK